MISTENVINKQNLIKSFNEQETKLSFAKVLDQVELCMKKHIYTFTDFLDPTKIEQYIDKLQYINGINYKIFGGYEDAERRIIGFCPDYTELTEYDFPIKAIKIKLLDKFCESLTHREYLGSILGTGIERSKLGDILVIDDYAITFIYENIADYIFINLSKVSRTKVENFIIELSDVILPQKRYKEIKATVASLRVDSIISTAFHISRGKASDFISAEKVNVNWAVVKSNSFSIKEGDIFTLRGYGRAKLVEITGKTRKDRIGILIYIYV